MLAGTFVRVKLEDCRRQRFLTREELAEKAGVSAETIRSIERGRRREPQLRIIKLLSEALGVEAREIDEFRRSLRLPPRTPGAG